MNEAFLHGDVILTREPDLTLAHLIRRIAPASPASISVIDEAGALVVTPYSALFERSLGIVGGLRRAGVTPGDRVIVSLENGAGLVTALWAMFLSGVVPVPVAPLTKIRDRLMLDRVNVIWRGLEEPLTLVDDMAVKRADVFPRKLVALSALQDGVHADISGVTCDPDSPALLQHTSGSSGKLTGVLLTHRNILSSLRATSQHYGLASDDTILSHLPLHHVLGLINLHLVPLLSGCNQVLLSPFSFARSPLTWLEWLGRSRARLTALTSSSLDYVCEAAAGREISSFDLSSLRTVLIGGEVISSRALERFRSTFTQAGLAASAITPSYGMTEAVSSVANTVGKARILSVRRSALRIGETVVEAAPGAAAVTRICSVGPVIPGLELRIVDEAGMILADDTVGEIQIRGEAVATQFSSGAAAQDCYSEDWFRTGDVGLVNRGELFVTGRTRDFVVVNGEKHNSHDLADIIGSVSGVCGNSIVIGQLDGGGTDGERTTALVGVSEDAEAIILAVHRHLRKAARFSFDSLVALPRYAFPRTPSQKLDRNETLALWRNGLLGPVLARLDANSGSAPLDSVTGRLRSRSASEAWTWLHELVEREVRHVLGVAADILIDVDQALEAYGLESTTAIRIRNRLSEELHQPLSATVIFEYPTIRTLVEHLGHAIGLTKPTAGGSDNHSPIRREAPQFAGGEPIAIIGMGCQFPGAANVREYWDLLQRGDCVIRDAPADRRSLGGEAGIVAGGGTDGHAWKGGFIDNIDRFDAGFFGLRPTEAREMDPQNRLVFEVAWECLENAGIAPREIKGSRTGIFLGYMTNDYAVMRGSPFCSYSEGTGRLAYFLDARGPTHAVDTWCSSSLVAIHLAFQSLQRGESELALAGGANLILLPSGMMRYEELGVMAPDATCKVFDRDANGIGRGEGAGIVALCRLSDAIRSGRRILATIRGTSTNSAGRGQGWSAPNSHSQRDLMREALASSGISPDLLSLVEAHGTGTSLGDPIELGAMKAALGADRRAAGRLPVGSCKANFGHLEGAAGIAGFCKLVLCLRHGEVPPQANLRHANAHLGLHDSRFSIPIQRRPLHSGAEPATAMVNAFGMSGTNACVVLEEPPRAKRGEAALAPKRRSCQLFKLSARTRPALRQLARRVVDHLSTHVGDDFGDLCHTANVGRADFEHRLAVVARSTADLKLRLRPHCSGDQATDTDSRTDSPLRLAFMFPGQGSQHLGMGRELYRGQPTFRGAFDRCAETFRALLDVSLGDLIFSSGASDEKLTDTLYAQPALFSVEWALAEMLRSWGIVPSAVVGHSLGEYVAAAVSGILRLEDAARLVATRARLMSNLPRTGGMLSMELDAGAAASLIAHYAETVSIAAVNAPRRTVISGDLSAIQEISRELEATKVRFTPLHVSHAFHSPLMHPACDALRQAARLVVHRQPTLMSASNLTGELVCAANPIGDDYWSRQLVSTVRFSAALETLLRHEITTFLEVGPDAALTALGRECLGSRATVLSTAPKIGDAWQRLFETVGKLYARGAEINWQEIDKGYDHHFTEFPTYPFERTRFWDEARRGKPPRTKRPPVASDRLTLTPPTIADDGHLEFQCSIGVKLPHYLRDHRVDGRVVFPAAGYLELVAAALWRDGAVGPFCLEDVAFESPLELKRDEATELLLALSPMSDARRPFSISNAQSQDGRRLGAPASHVRGRISFELPEDATVPRDLGRLRAEICEPVPLGQFYEEKSRNGIDYGPGFRGVAELWRRSATPSEVLARIAAPTAVRDDVANTFLHPALLDACLHVSSAAEGSRTVSREESSGCPHVPWRISRVTVTRRLEPDLWVHCEEREPTNRDVRVADLRIMNAAGYTLMTVEALQLRRISKDRNVGILADLTRWIHGITWERLPVALPARGVTQDRWLVLGGEPRFSNALCEALIQDGRAARFSATVADDDGLRAVDEALGRTEGRLTIVLLATPEDLTNDDANDRSASELEERVRQSCGSALKIVQHLEATPTSTPPRLVFVTCGSEPVERDDPVDVCQRPLGALAQVVGLECPKYDCHTIDLPAGPGNSSEQLARQLAGELAAHRKDRRIAVRPAGVFAKRIERLAWDMPVSQLIVRADATYLVIGGLGGIGLRAARWLLARGAGHTVLMSRRRLGVGEFHDICAAAAIDQRRVSVLSCDVSQEAELRDALVQIGDRLPLRGVIHAAGVVADGTLGSQTWDRFSQVLAPKLAGAWNLHRLTRHMQLDFFVCCSSIASLFGSAGQANYAAANAFLDALTDHRAAAGLPALSINWGPWHSVGMLADMAITGDHYRGFDMISPELGMRALEATLGTGLRRAAVVSSDWSDHASRHGEALFTHLIGSEQSEAPPSPAGTKRADSLRNRPAGARRVAIAEIVLPLIRDVLGLTPDHHVEPTRPLIDFGLDSLIAVELRNRLEAELGDSFGPTLFIDYPTLDAIVDHLAGIYSIAVAGQPEAPESDAGSRADRVQAVLESIAGLSDAELTALGEFDSVPLGRRPRQELPAAALTHHLAVSFPFDGASVPGKVVRYCH